MAVQTPSRRGAWLLAGSGATVLAAVLLARGLVAMPEPSASPVVGLSSPSAPASSTRAPSSVPPATMTTPTPTPTPRRRVDVTVPRSIDPTGVDDVTGALQRFLDAVPDIATIRFPAGGSFRVDGTLLLDGRRSLTFEGGGVTLFAGVVTDDPERAMWRLRDSLGIVFRDLVIRGAHPDPGTYVQGFEWQHGFDIQGGGRIEISGTTMERNFGDCVYITDHDDWAEDVWIHDSTCRENGRMGVAVVAGRRVIVERVDFSRIASVVMDLEPNPRTRPPLQGASDVVFRHNIIHDTESQLFSAGGHGPVSNVAVMDNDATGARYGLWSAVIPLDEHRRPAFVFRGNRALLPWRGGEGAALTFEAVDGLVVTDNIQPLLPFSGMLFARVDRSCDVSVTDNDAPGAVAQVRIEPFACG